MPESLAIPDRDILERLRARFALDADAIEFLPLGYDADAWVYRVHARGGDLFLKIRRGQVNEAGLAIPQLLASRGIPHLIAPIPTVTGEPFDAGDLVFALFPMVQGDSGGELGMTPEQWSELGATMRAIHDLPVDPDISSILRTETFVPVHIRMIREVQKRIEAGEHHEDRARQLISFWRSRQEQIERLVERTETLAPIARDRARGAVICHADIHAWNVLVTPQHDIVIVDWDSAMLAPRERDLMFADGVAGSHEADPDAFFRGYGDVEVDAEVMAYYRVEWTVQDLAEFSARVVLDSDAGDETKAESLEAFVRMFAPGNQVEVSMHLSGVTP